MRASLPESKVACMALAAVATLCYMLVIRLASMLIDGMAGGSSDYTVLVYAIAAVACALIYLHWKPSEFAGGREGANGRHAATFDLASAIFPLAAGAAACVIGAAIGDNHLLPTALNIVCLGIAAPVAEELLFRGLIQGWLETAAGAPFALAASTVLFALAHFDAGGFPGLLAAAIAGLLFGLVYVRRHSVAEAIAAHIVANLLAFVVACIL